MTKRKAELSLLLLALIFGSTFVVMEDAIKWIPPFTFLTIRFAVSALCLLLIVVFIRKSPIMRKPIWLLGFVLGGLLALGLSLQIFSLLYTTSGNSAFFTSSAVVIVPFFSLLLLSAPLTARWMISLSIVMIGLYLLSGSQLDSMNQGDLLAFLGAFAFALHIVCLKKWGVKLPVFSLNAVQFLSATLFCGLAAFSWEPWKIAFSSTVIFQPAVWIGIAVCSLLATVGGYVLQTYVQRYTIPNRTSLILTMEPIFAAIIDYWWNGVAITDWKLLGCCLIIMGVIWGQHERKSKTLETEHAT